jgi:hypothetical protein
MGATNVKALKQLGVSEKTPFFGFHSQEIAAVFELPLVTCSLNMM